MIVVDSRDIKKIRMLKYFIDAAHQIIIKEGIDSVTIRKVAEIAGYNSATIYNYFENRNELVSFASMKFIGDYVRALPAYMDKSQDIVERFLLMWECFCQYSFNDPEIYYAVFTEDIGEKPESIFKIYFSLFPEELGKPPVELIPMIMESDLTKRANLAIEPLVKEGYLTSELAREVDEMIMLMYQGMLSLRINKRLSCSVDEAVQRIMKYIRKLVESMITFF